MNIYAYREEFLPRIIEIFKGSVRHVCAADYSAVQTAAWLGGADYSAWDARFKGSNTFVAEEDGKIVAFGNIRQQDGGGYIDMLYTSKDFQGRGAATALCNKMEGIYGPVISAHSSVTALPFFLSRGYRIVRENTAVRCGVPLKNYLVTKG